MSLGATRSRIVVSMLAQSARWILAGAVIGTLASLAATRLLSSLLFGVSARDPLTLLSAIAVLTIVAFIATANPARKAAAIDPMKALRSA